MASQNAVQTSQRRVLVLCFDGTGNQFTGTFADSNIVKIFKMINGEDCQVFRYYQPGIGTYIEDSALSKTSRFSKMHSAYKKITDQMYGTSFDQHVRSGYQFLMQYYEEGSDIYLFGFSRGAYTARFLAQMLDCVGLLSRGNEEMFRFAWKAFSQWQSRLEGTEEQRKKKAKMYKFMTEFRETFGRPIRRIRFIGLFDTVNSVPRFESKWMARTKYPYVSRSSAKVVRHAVSIDERRAKFRQNLISQQRPHQYAHDGTHHIHSALERLDPHHGDHHDSENYDGEKPRPPPVPRRQTFGRFAPKRRRSFSQIPASSGVSINSATNADTVSGGVRETQADVDDDESEPSDIQEVWFPGQHGDVGGGWNLDEKKGEKFPLSYAPLVWMLREARVAGLPFDEDKLKDVGYILDPEAPIRGAGLNAPKLELDGEPLQSPISGPSPYISRKEFEDNLHHATTKGSLHDSLAFGGGLSKGSVAFWNFMEYLPFKRMDLKPDGTWAPIRWPLPCGETRDIPNEAVISYSAIKRMEVDPKYRPGNLIIGGGGRGVRVAPKEAGTGQWKIHRDEGDPIGQVYIRDMSEQNGKAQS